MIVPPAPGSIAVDTKEARGAILNRLRSAPRPFEDWPAAGEPLAVAPLDEAVLREEFIRQLKLLGGNVHEPATDHEAVAAVLSLIGSDQRVLAWDFDLIPLPGLAEQLARHGIAVAPHRHDTVRVGITGVAAALAATGSLVVHAGAKTPRTVSLLPHVHIAVVREAQIIANLEAYRVTQSAASFRQLGSVVVITGASRTADIAMELVHGAHGPAELHVVLV